MMSIRMINFEEFFFLNILLKLDNHYQTIYLSTLVYFIYNLINTF